MLETNCGILKGMNVLTVEYQDGASPRQGTIESVVTAPTGHFVLILWREKLLRDDVTYKSLVPLAEIAGVGGDGTQYRLFADDTDRKRYCAAVERFRYSTDEDA
jgi:hypothetical protein